MKHVYLYFFLLLIHPALAQRWPVSQERILQQEGILEVKPLQEAVADFEGSNPYWLLTLKDGSRGVFRSEEEPWGSRAELSGYRLDKLLGTELVPPTVDRHIRRDEWPGDWPWKTEVREGTIQLFVEGAEQADPTELSKDDLANSEILSFFTGRHDNHSGNLLVAPNGRAVLIDFEGSLDIQQVRYGQFPFLKRGGWAAHPWNISDSEPFPFDNPRKLVDPTLAEVQSAFGPWWGQIWPQGMKMIHGFVPGLPNRTIPFAIWGKQLWVQVPVRSRHAAHTDYYPQSTMEALKSLSLSHIEALFPHPYHRRHHLGFLERKEQLITAYKRNPKETVEVK